jgi:hypothetical protein
MTSLKKRLIGYWYSLVVVTLVIGALTGLLQQCFYVGGWSSAPLCAKIGVPTVFVTFIVFWTLMLEDFIDNADTRYRVLVGLSLFFFHWIAILIYFWTVVYRRKST